MASSSSLPEPRTLPMRHKDLGNGWVFVLQATCEHKDPREGEEFLSRIYAWGRREDISMWWEFDSAADAITKMRPDETVRFIFEDGPRRLTLNPQDPKGALTTGIALHPNDDPEETDRMLQAELDAYEEYRFEDARCMHLLRVDGEYLVDDHDHPHSLDDIYGEADDEYLDELARDLVSMFDSGPADEITDERIAAAQWKTGRWEAPLPPLRWKTDRQKAPLPPSKEPGEKD